MEKNDLKEIKQAIAEGHQENHKKFIKMFEERVEDFLGIDLSSPEGRQDCRDTWASAREVKNMKKTFWNRFWFILSGTLALGLISIIIIGLKEKFKQLIKGEIL